VIRFAALRAEMLTNPEVAAEYGRLAPVYELVGAMVEASHANTSVNAGCCTSFENSGGQIIGLGG